MEDSYRTEQLVRLKNFKQSRECKVYENLVALKSTFLIFEKNYEELINWLALFKDFKKLLCRYNLDTYDFNNVEKLEPIMIETSRLLHNFLASAQSLVEHTQVIINRLYSDHGFRKEYEIKVKQYFANSSIRLFVQRLRNYTQHYKLPILVLVIKFSEDSPAFNMVMDVNELKKWKDWQKAKSYLEKFKSHIYIGAIAEEYYVLIVDFYNWLNEQQQGIHKLDLENFSRMKKEAYGSF